MPDYIATMTDSEFRRFMPHWCPRCAQRLNLGARNSNASEAQMQCSIGHNFRAYIETDRRIKLVEVTYDD